MLKTEMITLRVTPEEKKKIKENADKVGREVTNYLVRLGLKLKV